MRHPFARDGQSDLLTIIGDESIDREFGTGAMKVTPAHDPADFELGLKHKLQFLSIFDDRGIMLPGFGPFSGPLRAHIPLFTFSIRFVLVYCCGWFSK